MAIYNDVRPIIAQRFNSEYGTALNFEDLKIEAIEANEIPDMLKYNTIITVSGAGKDPLAVFYNRTPIDAVVIGKRSLLMPNKNNDSIHKLLPTINKVLGLDLSVAEVVDAPVALVAGDVEIVIADSVNFTKDSKFTIELNVGMLVDNVPHHMYSMYNNGRIRPDIYQLPCSDNTYPGSKYGTATSFAGLVSASIDYTPIAYILRNVGISEQYYGDDRLHLTPRFTLGHAFAAMRTIDGNPYTNDATGQYNTYAWYPVYNGKTKDCKGLACRYAQIDMPQWIDLPERLAMIDLVNEEYDNVLIIRATNGTYSPGFKFTHLICHYNGIF